MDTLLQESSFTKPATPAAHAVAIAAAEARVERIPLASIEPSPNNPRKAFEGIEDLAASIASQGLLQPIVVRPLKTDGLFEIVAGERRYRALRHLKIDTALCRVIVADDGKARALQIIENLQREDIGPIEEAEAFKALHDLDPKTWTPQSIAKAVGKTDRFVQQRIAIAGGLLPALKTKLAQGELSVEVARTLAPLPTSLQESLQDHWAVRKNAIEEVRRAITEKAIPLSRAKFDPKLYTGDTIETGKKTFALDTGLFKQLQAVEAGKVVEKLKADWPDARLVDAPGAWHFADDQYGNDKPGGYGDKAEPKRYLVPKDRCTAIVWVHADGRIRQAVGVCSDAAWKGASKERETKAKSSQRGMNRTQAGETPAEKKAREAFNAALHKALAAKPVMAMRVLLLQMLTKHMYGASHHQMLAVLPQGLRKVAGRDEQTVWEATLQLTPEAVEKTLVAIGSLQTWYEYDGREVPPLLLAIGKAVGVEPAKVDATPPAKTEKAKPTPKAKAAPKAKTATKAKPKTAAKKKPAAKGKKS